MVSPFYVGVDVGTTSVRAALVDQAGKVLKSSVKDLTTVSPLPGHYEQCSQEIWSSCCHVIGDILQNVDVSRVHGLGFDATCSLVVLSADFEHVPVNHKGDGRNVIMWLDHRAVKQTKVINDTKHEVLKYVGGKVSLEMQSPKMLWLKQNLPEAWKKAAYFFDLPDFLTWKATGSLSRSMCSVVCKWTYLPSTGWSQEFWSQIGLPELAKKNFKGIGNEIKQIGGSVGHGVCQKASTETGLKEGTAVAVSIIDAHCGGIGVIGCSLDETNLKVSNYDLTTRVALISGTSSCHMALSKQPIHVPGVWGPYQGVMIPGYWVNEGGQSAVANLLDHIIQSHPAYNDLLQCASKSRVHVNGYLNSVLETMRKEADLEYVDSMAKTIHILPDFHGNRSPLADSEMKGMIDGLTLDKTLQGLALLYLAAMQSLALGTKHILDTMTKSGHIFKVVCMTGGLQKNPLFVQIHANVTGLPIVLAKEEESVLLGGAILAACASGNETFESATRRMCHVGNVFEPKSEVARFYDKKYTVFLKLAENQREYRNIMDSI